jgi:dienelactone hydrolase
MKRSACLLLLVLLVAVAAAPPLTLADTPKGEPFRVSEPGKFPADGRLTKLRTLDDKDFFMTVPPSKEAWEARRKELREQVLVALGLWPMPEKTPLEPVIHGKIDRDEYTIEKVFFASWPGHYVSGNLYRPKGKGGPLPGVLCPHGHWANGRFYDAGSAEAQKQVESKAEQTIEGARYPLQARCAMLARMGCVVFHYDMVGYADSQQIKHREGFTDVAAELRLQSFMGLQTWNSIRALDFLLSLPEVDPKRVGVTGASGGGTQTFILGAVDDRPAAAFPAVMVSTAMQGGCVCENCDYLRQGAGNIDLAALFAPKPLGMSGADDWTIDIERKGLPELQAVYRLYGAEDKVMAKCFPQFKHNYNQVSRELMYNWFNKHLQLGWKEPVTEKPFQPVPPKELSVFDEQHPLPKDAVDSEQLRRRLGEASDKQIEALVPKDAATLKEFQRVTGTALRVMIHDTLPPSQEVEAKEVGERQERDGVIFRRYLLSRKGAGEAVPVVRLMGKEFDGTVVVWVHPDGKRSLWPDGKLSAEARRILDRKGAILAADVLLTGEFDEAQLPPTPKQWAGFVGYRYGYNRPLLAERVHDVLTAVAFAKGHEKTKTVELLGWDKAGPWVLLARGLCGDAVARTAVDCDGFRFDKVVTLGDEMLLPGAVKYGGLPAFVALSAPGELYIHHHEDTGVGHWVRPAYAVAGMRERLTQSPEKATPDKVLDWLLR